MVLVAATVNQQNGTHLVVVRTRSKCKRKVIQLILACLSAILILLIILFVLRKFTFTHVDESKISNTTIGNEILDTTSTAIGVVTQSTTLRGDEIHFSEEALMLQSTTTVTTTTVDQEPLIYSPTALSEFWYADSHGLSLSHSLYFNIKQYNMYTGFIVNVSVRLFTSWKGESPLYIFVLSVDYLKYEMLIRYPVYPKSNNTDWQTFDIPYGKILLLKHNLLAIGMQDASDTNKLYAVRSDLSVHGANITKDSISFYPKGTYGFYGAAFTYSLIVDENAAMILP